MVSYNVLSLFDGKDDGTEFDGFSVREGSWGPAPYRRRLANLATVLLAAVPGCKGPDIAVLPEIENADVLAELAGELPAGSGYRWRAIAPAPGGAFATGLLSRFPLLELRAHGLSAGAADSRHLLEAIIDIGGRRLVLLALHWKSKSGGAEATEEARREAAALAAGRAAEILAADPEAELLLAGDFNESPDEWLRVGRRYPTALFPASGTGALPAGAAGRLLLVTGDQAEAGLRGSAAGGTAGGNDRPDLVLYSPWSAAGGWSYLYEGREERIDGFLLAPGLLDGEGLSLASFRALALPFLLDAAGAPLPWSSRTGRGWSDHLPLLLELSLSPAEGEGGGAAGRMKKSQKSRVESP